MIRYDSPELRRAYIQGARDALDSLLIACPPLLVRETEDWIATDLTRWDTGGPPLSPSRWDDVSEMKEGNPLP